MLEEDLPLPAVPVLADVSEFHGMLAVVAERHFREHAVKEVETLTAFMYTLKAKGEALRCCFYFDCCPRCYSLSDFGHVD